MATEEDSVAGAPGADAPSPAAAGSQERKKSPRKTARTSGTATEKKKSSAKGTAAKAGAGASADKPADSTGKGSLRLRLRAFDSRLLDRTASQITQRAKEGGASVRGPIPLPVKTSKTTILISPHKYKDARDQYEIRAYTRLIDIHNLDSVGFDRLSRLDLPAGVAIKIKNSEVRS